MTTDGDEDPAIKVSLERGDQMRHFEIRRSKIAGAWYWIDARGVRGRVDQLDAHQARDLRHVFDQEIARLIASGWAPY